MTVFEALTFEASLSLVKRLPFSVLVDKVLESSDFKTSFDESLSTPDSLVNSDTSSILFVDDSSIELEVESVTFTSLA